MIKTKQWQEAREQSKVDMHEGHWKSDEIDGLREELASVYQQRAELLEALKDMRNGWRYIRETHGDLYGVGWDRAEGKANAAISKVEASE